MYPETFDQLHRALVDWHGLQSTEEFDSMEALGMVLWACGTSQSQTQMQYRFGKSKGSVSQKFGEVLEALFSFAHRVIWPKDENYSTIHHKLSKYSPYFDGYIGALDGTHIPVEVSRNERDDYINRTGRTTQNVLAICDFDMQYTYIGVGMVEANHDMAILKKGLECPKYPHPPRG